MAARLIKGKISVPASSQIEGAKNVLSDLLQTTFKRGENTSTVIDVLRNITHSAGAVKLQAKMLVDALEKMRDETTDVLADRFEFDPSFSNALKRSTALMISLASDRMSVLGIGADHQCNLTIEKLGCDQQSAILDTACYMHIYSYLRSMLETLGINSMTEESLSRRLQR